MKRNCRWLSVDSPFPHCFQVVQLLRAEIAGLEILFSMLVPEAIMISHPLVR